MNATSVDWGTRARPVDSVLDTAGFTPMVRLRRLTGDVSADILVKLEYFGPSGSVKDRILPVLVRRAVERGTLRPGMTIIEATTGNTGIATAMTAAAHGYPAVIVMPEGMSDERKKAIRAYGARLELTPGGESDVDLVLDRVRAIKAQEPDRYWEVGQFSNLDNIEAHYRTTGPEVWEQTSGSLDAFVDAQGTGGTLTGVARYLRERREHIAVYAAEPSECPILAGGGWGPHRIEGIGDGFIPDNLHIELLTGVIEVSSDEAIDMARRLAREEGIFCGISSGCNVAAALKLARRRPELRSIVTLICDNGLRYLSTELCGVESALDVPDRDHPTSESDGQKLQGHPLEVIR